MRQMMGVINLIQEQVDLGALTAHRCVAAVPFGGRYRLIDFILSNMVNAGIEDVAVFTENNVRPLMDHLGSGKEWDLDRKRGGLFVLPAAQSQVTTDVEQLQAQRDFFYRGKQEYIVWARSHHVCNLDLQRVLYQHEQTNADVTMVYHTTTADVKNTLMMDGSGRVVSVQPAKNVVVANAPIEVYVMNRSWLLHQLDHMGDAKQFVEQFIFQRLQDIRVYGFAFEGYVASIDRLERYYQHSMELLQPEVLRELFFRGAPIYTKVKDEPPAKYCDEAHVHNSLIANGCIINGHVENSILFRGVRVAKGVVVRNSIVMQNCELSEHATVQHAILDKDVFVDPKQVVHGRPEQPVIVPKKVFVCAEC